MEHDSGPQPVSPGIHTGVVPTNTLRTGMQESAIAMAWCFRRVINLTDDAFDRLEPDSELYVARLSFGPASRLSMMHIIASLA